MQPDIVTINRAGKTGYPLTSITWPYRGLKYRPIEYFLLSADNLLVFKWSQAQVHFFKCIRNELSRTIKIFISIWPRTRKFSQLLRAKQGRQLLLTFLAMDTRWSRSTSNFYVLIGQNLTGEFMRRVYAASENLFTLIAEADKVLCRHLVMFLTTFFHWMYKMKYNCHQDSFVIHGSFVYWVFGWEMRRLSKIGNPISHGVVFVFHLAW